MSDTLERPRHKKRELKETISQKKRESKKETIEFRATQSDKALLAAAAHASHTSMSDFVLRSAMREAEHTLADRRVFMVSDENWSAFMDILSAPAVPDPHLLALARSRPPWVR